MKYNKKSLLLSAVTLGLLTSNLEANVVHASNKTDSTKNDSISHTDSPVPISQEDGTTYHIVRSGNTVYNISNKYTISQDELITWNNITDNIIIPNQVLSVNGVNVYQDIIKEKHNFSSSKQFINHVAPIALKVAKEYGLYPSVMIAQATLETGSGTSELATIANNYFGIKGTYKGNSIYKLSPEEINGKIINESSRFRVYPTLYESFVDNGSRLRNGPAVHSTDKSWNSAHYKGTWVENTKSYHDATQALVDAGYATDSKYPVKLNAIIEEFDLIEYDKKIYDFIDESITEPETPVAAPKEDAVAAPKEEASSDKRDTSSQAFLKAAKELPTVSTIKKMNKNQLAAVKTKMASARSLYNGLSSTAKKDKEVIRWAGYLSDKEATANASSVTGEAFIKAADSLPSISRITAMNEKDLAGAADAIAQAQAIYETLPANVKKDSQVAKWAGYVTQKAVAVSQQQTALSTDAPQAFINAVLGLPNLNQIAKMNPAEITATQATVKSARGLYNALSAADKADAKVARWAGYLADKEAALSTGSADAFIDAVHGLPSVNQIAKMNKNETTAAQAKVKSARGLHTALSTADKADAKVTRWAGYLTDKETALSKRAASFLTNAVENFGKAVLSLPSLDQIDQMNKAETTAAQAEVKSVRALYNALPAKDKTNARVVRWFGYLTEKETAINYNSKTTMSQRFLTASSHLPTVSAINKMTVKQLENLTPEFEKVRALYNNLSSSDRRDEYVARWAGYLTDKEAAVANIFASADAFVHQVSQTPTVSALRAMNASQLANAQTKLKAARNSYNALTQAAKRFSEVARWEGYLSEKENAIGGTSSVRLKDDLLYVVESGDTLAKIADKFNVSVNSLINKNPKLNPNRLSAGQNVIVPNALARPMDQPQARDGKHVIYLDAGHGGWESGAAYSGTTEKQLNLTIARKLTSKLESMGYTVINSRTTDKHVDLLDRSKDANASNGDVFVSLHHNAMGIPNSNVSGIETFYYRYNVDYPSSINQKYHNHGERIANSAYLAKLVQDNLIDTTGANDRGVKASSFRVLRETSLPSILIEFGFMDNSSELAKLKSNSYQDKMANAVAKGLDTYFKTLYK